MSANSPKKDISPLSTKTLIWQVIDLKSSRSFIEGDLARISTIGLCRKIAGDRGYGISHIFSTRLQFRLIWVRNISKLKNRRKKIMNLNYMNPYKYYLEIKTEGKVKYIGLTRRKNQSIERFEELLPAKLDNIFGKNNWEIV
jgi:hypothetical protein